MPIPIFDTVKYANARKAADVPDKQAEAQAYLMGEALGVNLRELATKDDLRELEQRLNTKMDKFAMELTGKVDKLDAKMDVQLADVRGEIKQMKWMFGVMTTGIVGILIRLFFVRI